MNNDNILDIVVSIFNDINQRFISNFFNVAQPIIHSLVLKFLFMILLLFYILYVMIKKQGQIEISDFYLAFKYLIIFISLHVATLNLETYQSLLKIFELPHDILEAIVLQLLSLEKGENTGVFSYLSTSLFGVLDFSDKINVGGWIITAAIQVIFLIMILITFILLTGVIVLSSFLAKTLLALAIIVIPCYLIPPWRGIVWGWAKLYISYSLYAPLGIFFGSFIISSSQYVISFAGNAGNSSQMNYNSVIALIVVMAINAFVITKIPTIVNQIVGSSNDNGSGAIGMVTGASILAKSIYSTAKDKVGSSIGSKITKETISDTSKITPNATNINSGAK